MFTIFLLLLINCSFKFIVLLQHKFVLYAFVLFLS